VHCGERVSSWSSEEWTEEKKNALAYDREKNKVSPRRAGRRTRPRKRKRIVKRHSSLNLKESIEKERCRLGENARKKEGKGLSKLLQIKK